LTAAAARHNLRVSMGIMSYRFAGDPRSARSAIAAAVLTLCPATQAIAQTGVQGVLAHEVIVGTHVDLSGPLSPWGKAVKNGLTMAINEANEAGGVNGRAIRLIVKDDGYDSTQAAIAVRQLVTQDRVFAILSPLGTPTVNAATKEALSRNVLYLFPLTASADAYSPAEPMKFALTPSHEMEMQEGLRRILNARGPLKVGVLAPDDAFGRAVRQGAVNELTRRGLGLEANVSFTRGKPEFGPTLAKLRAQHVDVVVLGAEAEETLALMRAAGEIGWRPIFLCSSACYAPEFVTLGGSNVEGLYAVGQFPIPYADDRQLGIWVRRYEAEFSAIASVQALNAYRSARYFLAVLRQTGANPTQAGFAHILETREAWTDPVLGGLPIEFSPVDHLGSHSGMLAQIRRGRWVVLADNLVAARP